MSKGSISISRPQCSSGERFISITIKDEDAGIQFVQIKVELADFAEAVTGLGFCPCEFEAIGLQNVGKRIERQPFKFKLPSGTMRDKKVAVAIARKAAPAGWTISEYFGSQDSFFNVGKEEWARTTISRWVEK